MLVLLFQFSYFVILFENVSTQQKTGFILKKKDDVKIKNTSEIRFIVILDMIPNGNKLSLIMIQS